MTRRRRLLHGAAVAALAALLAVAWLVGGQHAAAWVAVGMAAGMLYGYALGVEEALR